MSSVDAWGSVVSVQRSAMNSGSAASRGGSQGKWPCVRKEGLSCWEESLHGSSGRVELRAQPDEWEHLCQA